MILPRVEDYERFIYELLGTPRRAQAVRSQYYNSGIQLNLNKVNMEWFIENKSLDKRSVAATKTYGTSRMDAYSIFESIHINIVRAYGTDILHLEILLKQ